MTIVQERIRYENVLIAELDHNIGMNYAREEGIKEGKIEGEYNKNLEIAKYALLKGSAIEFVSEITGLHELQIKQLQKDLNI